MKGARNVKKRRKRRARTKKHNPLRRIMPYLKPDCPIGYARGIYQGEGSHFCAVRKKLRTANPETVISMWDKEAIDPLTPCFGREPYYDSGRGWVNFRTGRAAVAIAKALAITPRRKRQIERAKKRCEDHWRRGYGGRIR